MAANVNGSLIVAPDPFVIPTIYTLPNPGKATTNILLQDNASRIQKMNTHLEVGGTVICQSSIVKQNLLVEGNVTFNGSSGLNLAGDVRITSTTPSTSPTTGALVVAGGLGIGGSLNVGGSITFSGKQIFSGDIQVLSGTESISPSTGSITTAGGVGIQKRLNVAGNTELEAALTLDALSANGLLYTDGTKTVQSTAPLTNGQVLIGSTGSNPVANTLTGTANQIGVLSGPGTITLSTPQNIAPTSNVSFNTLAVTGSTPGAAYIATGTELLTGAALSSGQVLVGSSGANPIPTTVTGTSPIVVTGGPGSLNVALSGSLPATFASMTLTNTSNQLTMGTATTTTLNATAPAANQAIIVPDSGLATTASFLLTNAKSGTQALTNTTTSSSSGSGALTLAGGLGVTGNINTAANVGFDPSSDHNITFNATSTGAQKLNVMGSTTTGTAAAGGAVNVTGGLAMGTGASAGGAVVLTGGAGSASGTGANGGSVQLAPGASGTGGVNGTIEIGTGATVPSAINIGSGSTVSTTINSSANLALQTPGGITSRSATATPAAASATAALAFGSANLAIYWGTGDPNAALTAPQGSLYLRADGSTNTRLYVNSSGSTAWIPLSDFVSSPSFGSLTLTNATNQLTLGSTSHPATIDYNATTSTVAQTLVIPDTGAASSQFIMNQAQTGMQTITGTVSGTSGTGALVVSGGLGVTGQLNLGTGLAFDAGATRNINFNATSTGAQALTITGSQSTGAATAGGSVNVTAGLAAGTGASAGGALILTGGAGSSSGTGANGGSVQLVPGASGSGGVNGTIEIGTGGTVPSAINVGSGSTLSTIIKSSANLALQTPGGITSRSATATPAAASATTALSFGSANLAVYWGTGDPNTALTAPQGSLYLRADGSTNTRLYVNSSGSTAWTPLSDSGSTGSFSSLTLTNATNQLTLGSTSHPATIDFNATTSTIAQTLVIPDTGQSTGQFIMNFVKTGGTQTINGTSSGSSSTGALVIAGGLGVSGINSANGLGFDSTTDQTITFNTIPSTTTRSLTIRGCQTTGASVAGGSVFINGGLAEGTGTSPGGNVEIEVGGGTSTGQILLGTNAGLVPSSIILGSASSASTATVAFTTGSASSTTGALVVSGGVGISGTTAATSVTNGGALTVAGGCAIAQNLLVASGTTLANSSANVLTLNYTGAGTFQNALTMQMAGSNVAFLQYQSATTGITLLNGTGLALLMQASGSTSDKSILSNKNTLDDGSGNMTLAGSLKLPTTGGTATGLNYYQEFTTYTSTFTFTGSTTGSPPTTAAVTIQLTRIGRIVNVFCQTDATASGSTFTASLLQSNTSVPLQFRPATIASTSHGIANNNGTKGTAPGLISIATSGVISMYTDSTVGVTTWTSATGLTGMTGGWFAAYSVT